MKTKNIIFVISAIFLFLIFPSITSAHQPRLVKEVKTTVVDPEISKAYYAKLEKTSNTYTIQSDTDFNLYVNILVPKIENQKKDVSFSITKDGKELATYLAEDHEWKEFWEEFGRNWYWMGAEYREKATPGTYEITVWSSQNDSKYSLAIGEIETFDSKESMNALKLIPEIKKNFFEESPITFLLSPFGWSYILILFVLSFIFGFLYRFILKKFSKKSQGRGSKNINKKDRYLRFGFGIALFILAITTSWSPYLFFFSGFCFFEAIFSWCGFYAAIGKRSCPL